MTAQPNKSTQKLPDPPKREIKEPGPVPPPKGTHRESSQNKHNDPGQPGHGPTKHDPSKGGNV